MRIGRWVCVAALVAAGGMMFGQIPANVPLQRVLEGMAAEPAVARAHWGISVVRMDGTVAAGVNAGQFFQPASNAKLFTTAAAMALLPMDERLATKVIASGYFEPGGVYRGDLRLRGVGGCELFRADGSLPRDACRAGGGAAG